MYQWKTNCSRWRQNQEPNSNEHCNSITFAGAFWLSVHFLNSDLKVSPLAMLASASNSPNSWLWVTSPSGSFTRSTTTCLCGARWLTQKCTYPTRGAIATTDAVLIYFVFFKELNKHIDKWFETSNLPFICCPQETYQFVRNTRRSGTRTRGGRGQWRRGGGRRGRPPAGGWGGTGLWGEGGKTESSRLLHLLWTHGLNVTLPLQPIRAHRCRRRAAASWRRGKKAKMFRRWKHSRVKQWFFSPLFFFH